MNINELKMRKIKKTLYFGKKLPHIIIQNAKLCHKMVLNET